MYVCMYVCMYIYIYMHAVTPFDDTCYQASTRVVLARTDKLSAGPAADVK